MTDGTRHKAKAAEKAEERVEAVVGSSSPDKKGEAAKDEKKEKPKKKTPKDANGNDLKRPLSAYMLYNNHRRPVLRNEHPGKSPIRRQDRPRANQAVVQNFPSQTSPS